MGRWIEGEQAQMLTAQTLTFGELGSRAQWLLLQLTPFFCVLENLHYKDVKVVRKYKLQAIKGVLGI